jgi:ATP-binding protein involved in chromosome partitioning
MDVPVKVEVRGGAEVVLTWEDGTVTVVTARELRAACPCAFCRDPGGMREVERILESDRPVRIAAARAVGNYALGFTFDPDGHETGIFPFTLVRDLGGTPA